MSLVPLPLNLMSLICS